MKSVLLAVIAVTLMSTSGHAFTTDQHRVLDIAKLEGQEAQFPETIQAIALQESLAGAAGRHGDKHFKDWKKRSYGIMQVRFVTAKWILHLKFGSHIYTDAGLLHNLTYNDKFNIFVGRIYFEYLYNRFKGHDMRWTKSVLAYNFGIGNVLKHGLSKDPNDYVKKVHQRIKSLRTHIPHKLFKTKTSMKEDTRAHTTTVRSSVPQPSYYSPSGF